MNKRHCYILLFSIVLTFVIGCKKKDHSWIQDTEGYSILDLEYINDTLGIVLKDIRLLPLDQNKNLLKVYLLAEESEHYSGNHSFFLHFYAERSREREGEFISVRADSVITERDALVFTGNFESDKNFFEMVRYGLVNSNKKRLFTLTIDSVKTR